MVWDFFLIYGFADFDSWVCDSPRMLSLAYLIFGLGVWGVQLMA